jgi:hypothetical protein
MISSFSSINKNIIITKIWLIGKLNLGQSFRLTAYLFGCVIAFSVNSPNDLVSAAHLVFTGLAILSGYVALMTH